MPNLPVLPALPALLAAGTVSATAAGAAATPSASPAAGARHHGECHARMTPGTTDVIVPENVEFVLAAVVALTSDGAASPVTATVRCELRGAASVEGAATGTGTGVVAVAGRTVVDVTTARTLCTVVDFADATPTAESCAPLDTQVPPQAVVDAVGTALGPPDAAACAGFAAAVPGAGPVVVADGDLYVGGELWWDCPAATP